MSDIGRSGIAAGARLDDDPRDRLRHAALFAAEVPDGDLAAAVDELESEIRAWRLAVKLRNCCSDPQCRARRERAIEEARR